MPSFRCLSWLKYVWHGSFICGTWLICMGHDSFICGTWLIHMGHDSFICDMTHLCVRLDSFMWYDPFIRNMTHPYVTREVDQKCPHSNVRHDSLMVMTLLVYMIWRIHKWHDSFICDTGGRSKVPLLWCIYMYDMSRSYVTWLIYLW